MPIRRSTLLAARCASALSLVGVAGILTGTALSLAAREGFWDAVGAGAYTVGIATFAVGLGLMFLPRRVDVDPLVVASPVRGRWVALHSPTTRVPSHGLHAYGQTYAIDLVHDPGDGSRAAFGSGPQMAPPTAFPAFGQPLHAPADGVVVRAVGRFRDHRSRTGWLSLVYLLVEGAVRELGGPGPVLGNHLVLRLDDGTYLLLAHLRRGSLAVRTGDRVVAGHVVARCGNSGNSSEPHLHVQRMDHPRPLLAVGLPFAVRGGAADGGDGLPGNGEALVGRPAA